jgi:hypothetical protein
VRTDCGGGRARYKAESHHTEVRNGVMYTTLAPATAHRFDTVSPARSPLASPRLASPRLASPRSLHLAAASVARIALATRGAAIVRPHSSQPSTVSARHCCLPAALWQTMLKYLEAMADDEDKETVARACEGFGRLAKLVGPVRRWPCNAL